MGEHCSDPYSPKWIKKKLLARLPDSVLVCSQNGKKDVVLLHESANKLINEFRLVGYFAKCKFIQCLLLGNRYVL